MFGGYDDGFVTASGFMRANFSTLTPYVYPTMFPQNGMITISNTFFIHPLRNEHLFHHSFDFCKVYMKNQCDKIHITTLNKRSSERFLDITNYCIATYTYIKWIM